MARTPPRLQPRKQPKIPAAHRMNTKFAPFGAMKNVNVAGPQTAFNPVTPQASGVSMGAQATGPTAPDIRDPEYWLNIENIKQYYGTTQAGYGEQRRQDVEARDRALTILGEKEPTDVRQASESANKAGLFYSGILGRNLGDIATSYTRQREQIGSDFTGRENLRQIAEQGLKDQYGPGGIQERTSIYSAGERAKQAAIDNPPPPIAQTGAQYLAQAAKPATAKSIAAALAKRRKASGVRI